MDLDPERNFTVDVALIGLRYHLGINPLMVGLRAIWHAAIFRAFFLQDDASYSSHLVLDLVTPMPSTT